MKSLSTDNYQKNLKPFPSENRNKAPFADKKSKNLSPLVGPENGVTPASSARLQKVTRLSGRASFSPGSSMGK